MVTIDSSLVRQEIKRMVAISQGLAKQVKVMFERLESSPSEFDKLAEIDPMVTEEFANVTLRKVYLTSGRQNFRVVFAHWKDTDFEHVDLLLAFPRKRGYEIDWDWIRNVLRRGNPL